jgi:hypothetical protein
MVICTLVVRFTEWRTVLVSACGLILKWKSYKLALFAPIRSLHHSAADLITRKPLAWILLSSLAEFGRTSA